MKNKGFTLIESLVIFSVMFVAIGIVGYGISVVFHGVTDHTAYGRRLVLVSTDKQFLPDKYITQFLKDNDAW